MNARRIIPLALLFASMTAGSLLAACDPTAGPKELMTDPHEIVVTAIRSTASLSFARLHLQFGVSTRQGAGADMSYTFDADMDLVQRELAGKVTSSAGVGNAGRGGMSTEFVLVDGTAFSRTAPAVRWTSSPGGGFGPGTPTNAQAAAALEKALATAGVQFQLLDAQPCALGTCYHVLVNADAKAVWQFVSALSGAPIGGAEPPPGAQIPPVALDLLVDQATGVVAEVRAGASIQGTEVKVVLGLTNPDVSLRIVAPPADLVSPAEGLNGGDLNPIGPEVSSEAEPQDSSVTVESPSP